MAREYKDSGIEWIGRIPREWKVTEVKRFCHNITDGSHFSPITQNEGKPYITVSNVYNDKIHVDEAAKISEKDFDSLVANGCQPPKGSVLLAKDGTVGRTAIVDDNDYVVLSSLGILDPSNSITSRYLKYLLDSDALQAQMQLAMAGSALRRITITKINNLIGLIPPLSEQQRITDYLDEKCDEIDSLISLQEQMIAQLTDYKQSVITEAVTKGLDPNVELVPSGIDWIGDIPKVWTMVRLKYLCTIQTGNQDTQDSNPLGVYPFYVRSPIVERSDKYSFEGEGILMAGDGAGAGRVFHHVYGKYAVHQRVYRLANIKGINSNFLFYFLSSLFCKEMDRGSAQSTVPSVRLPMLQNFNICIPSFEEQKEIVDYLDNKCAEIDALIALKQRKIETLKNYKKSLIYEAVTGKIEVV
jgi:type I restriction enzyme S subunit